MRYFFLAGEPSGDLNAGNFARELVKLDPQTIMQGWGGEKMKDAGVAISTTVDELAFMGFWEVIKNLRRIRRLFKKVKEDILAFQPDVVVLVDYPGFNLRLARWLKKKDIKVAWYISPQLWAWRPGRAKIIQENVGLLMVILPFETAFYTERGITAHYLGHPLLDVIQPPVSDLSSPEKEYIALLPGSRKQEIEQLLPVMYEVATRLPHERFIVAARSGLSATYPTPPDNVTLQYDSAYSILAGAKAAIVTSGTATLETALWGIPQVVVYKAGRVSYAIAKRLVRVPYISLVNLVAEKKVVPELIQDACTADHILKELAPLLSDSSERTEMVAGYSGLLQKLGTAGASKKAAGLLYDFVK